MEDLRTYTTQGPSNQVGAPQSSQGSGGYTHTLRRGETLADVARQYGITMTELLEANPDLNPYYYRAGDVLNIPTACAGECCEGRLYCVRQGDTLEYLAEGFGVTMEAIMEANPVLYQTGLLAGQIICIPKMPQPDLCPGGATQVQIQEGQTYLDVMVAYNVSFNALSALNIGLDLLNLQPGDVVCVPPSGSHGTCLDCSATYLIQAGENLLTVAERAGVDPGELLVMNPTLLPNEFIQGQMICLP